MRYRPEIDGLRALSVIPVVIFHAGFELFSGGFIGVDIFFVISGYLITSIIYPKIVSQRFSFLDFYERRARRILPALFFVLAICVPAAFLLMLPGQLKDFGQSLVSVNLFSSNFLFWSETGYFAPASEEKPLLHTWSLAVEEQFYFLFPPFLILLLRFGKQFSFVVLAVIFLASLILSELLSRHFPSANFYLLPSRSWELLAGSLVAIFLFERPQRSNNVLSFLGLLLVIFSVFYFDQTTPAPGFHLLVPVLGSVLIIIFGGDGTFARKVLAARLMVGIGLISYSVYLWHQPLFAFLRVSIDSDPSAYVYAIFIIFSFFLGYLSWRFIERPFRSPRSSFLSSRFIFWSSLSVTLIFIALGLFFHFSDGAKWRFAYPEVLAEHRMPSRDDGFCYYNFNSGDVRPGLDGVDCGFGEGRRNILLFGDSFAAQWEPVFSRLAFEHDLTVRSVTTNWCLPSLSGVQLAPPGHGSREQCSINTQWLLASFKGFDTVVFAGAWHGLVERRLEAEFFKFLEHLLAISDVRIVVLDVPPQLRRDRAEAAVYDMSLKLSLDNLKMDRANFFRKLFYDRFLNEPQLVFIEREKLVFGVERGYKTRDGFPYSHDGGHISVYGALSLFDEGYVGPLLIDLLFPGG